MKLLATTTFLLALAAPAVHAQSVEISGDGRMGLMGLDAGGWVWMQENQLFFDFGVSVEGDHGLSFGALSSVEIANGTTGIFSGSNVWVEARGLRLTFGNTDGALTNAGYLGGGGVGYEGGILNGDGAGLDAIAQEMDTAGGGPVLARVDYTMGDTVVSLSHERGAATEVGLSTTFDAFTVAFGYSNAVTNNWALSGQYDGGSWGAGLLYASVLGANNWSLSGTVGLGGGDLYGYVGEVFGDRAYGLSYSYGLGGGANLTTGVERVGLVTGASVGVAFEF